jgi:hypothetical protein
MDETEILDLVDDVMNRAYGCGCCNDRRNEVAADVRDYIKDALKRAGLRSGD